MKKLLTASFLSVALVLGCALSARADDPSKQAKAAKLVDTMHMEKNMSLMMDSVSTHMKQSFSAALGDKATPKQRQIFDGFMSKVLQLLQTQMSWSVLKPEMIKLYVNNFTEEELDGLNTFYSSPVGQSTLEKMPVTMQQSMGTMQAHMATLEPQMRVLQENFAKQMQATMPQPPAKTGPATHPAPSKH